MNNTYAERILACRFQVETLFVQQTVAQIYEVVQQPVGQLMTRENND